MCRSAETRSVLLRGEIIQIAGSSGRRVLTVVLDPQRLAARAGLCDDVHLGDRVRVEALVRVVAVEPDIPAVADFPGRARPRPDRPSRPSARRRRDD